eukprot:gene4861-5612_t
MPSAMVDLNVPPAGDATASYVALSRVRHRNDLFILRIFKRTELRRSGSNAGVDILLQRLRGKLGANAEGSKLCMGCRLFKPRSAFVCAEKQCTRQWNHRNRQCLACFALARRDRDDKLRANARQCIVTRNCYGHFCNGAPRPREDFHRGQRSEGRPPCKRCARYEHRYQLCYGKCGKKLRTTDFTWSQLEKKDEPRCKACLRDSNPNA